MLMTIVVLLFENVVIGFLHGGLLHPPRFADDAAENTGNALGAKRSLVLFANPVKDLLLALAVINRQAGRFLDRRQLMRDRGPLVEQPEHLCIQGVDGFPPVVEGCIGVWTIVVRGCFHLHRLFRAAEGGCGPHWLPLIAHDSFSHKIKSRDSWRSAACGFYDVYLYAMKSLHTIRYAATPER